MDAFARSARCDNGRTANFKNGESPAKAASQRPMSFLEDIQRGIRRNGTPVTIGIIALSVAAFLIEWTLHPGLYQTLHFAANRIAMPWTAVTYPFASVGDGRNIVWFAFTLLWIWWTGSVIERDMGSGRFAAFWVAMSVLPALAFTFFYVLGVGTRPLFELWLPEAALTVAWATRYPNAVVRLIVFPVEAKWVGALAAAGVLFGFGTPIPLLGVAACLHLALAWAIASNRIPFLPYKAPANGGLFGGGRGAKVATRHGMMSESFFDDVRRREKERKEKEALRKLFERSLIDDPDEKGRDAGS